MQLQGSPEFTGLVDIPTYTQMLRELGMPEHRIESLIVQFMHEIPAPWVTTLKLFSRPWGMCEVTRNRILLATYYVEEAEDREKALQDLNRVLLHETGHACNPWFTLFCMATMPLIMIGCMYGAFFALDWGLHVVGIVPEIAIRIVSSVALFVVPLLLIKPFYRYAPNERLSQRFEKLGVRIIRE